MKKTLLISVFAMMQLCLWAQMPEITEAKGWFESAFATWAADDSADSYNVYFSGEGISKQKIDDHLIRSYGTFYRADVIGLKPGTYTIKVVPVIDGSEAASAVTNNITVMAYDRSGFAFSDGRVPGAYKADGTPKNGAVIIYITENNKNTISMNVTGANSNPCIGLKEILDGFKKGNDTRPLIVRLVGQITDLASMDKGDIVIENNNNSNSYITIEGVGDDAVADGWGIRIKNATNIEIRNIATMNCDSNEGDNIGLQQNNSYIWIHHNDFFYGHAGGDSDQQKGDGAMDVKGTEFVTISYNHFWDTGKSSLLGLNEDTSKELYVTYHHNWFDHSDSRHPRVRSYTVHVYNNYFDGISKYGIGNTTAGSVFSEGNYFRNAKYPMLISQQGTDIHNGTGTFSGEDGGIIKAYNNIIIDATRFVAYGDPNSPNSTVDFDAWVTNERNATVPSSVKTKKGGHTYNNFDTNSSIMYSYTADSPEDAKSKVMQYAGRMFGGDFSFTFNNDVDDTSYAVNPALKTALTNYQTKLVYIQGDSEQSGGGDIGGGDGGEIVEGEMVHNFTISGTNSSFYSISGNLSDTKGTVLYGGLTLIRCLKIESATSITFTTASEALLTLVFNDDFNGKIKINNIDHSANNGQLSLQISAGNHTITKNSTANLFYMSVEYLNATGLIEPNKLISVYPNPVTDILHVSSTINVEKVEVYNLSGILIDSVIDNTSNIKMSNYKNGTYLILIHADNNIHKQVIIKK